MSLAGAAQFGRANTEEIVMRRTFLMMVAASALCGNTLTYAQDQSLGPPPGITVTGIAEIKTKPNMAIVRFLVHTDADTAAAAIQQNQQRLAQIVRVLLQNGVASEDVQSGDFSVTPNDNYDEPGEVGPMILDYTVTAAAKITVRNLSNLGQLLDLLAKAGAHRIAEIRFASADPAALREEAYCQALADAHKNAELFARSAGVRLGQLLAIQDQQLAITPPASSNLLPNINAPQAIAGPVSETVSAQLIVRYAIGAARADGTAPAVKPAAPGR
jgi:uncharacterized protein YggE